MQHEVQMFRRRPASPAIRKSGLKGKAMNVLKKRTALIGVAVALSTVALASVLGTTERTARADTTGTPTPVGAYGCIVNHGGQVTRPAGSTIVIRQAIAEQTLGILNNFLQAQTTIVSVNDKQMFDASKQWGTPFLSSDGFWFAVIDVPSGVTLAQPGDQMRFTFALLLSTQVPEIFNPAVGGQPGQPLPNGPGLVFGGTCTVTAT
jgi:hypothetical protein